MIVYLLHCEAPGSIAHYVGSARNDQFARRIADHVAGNGSAETRRLYDTHQAWWLAAWWQLPSRSIEHAMHRLTTLDAFCPICSPRLAVWHNPRTLKLAKRPRLQPEDLMLTWSSACGPDP